MRTDVAGQVNKANPGKLAENPEGGRIPSLSDVNRF